MTGMTMDIMREQAKAAALERVRRELALGAIVAAENITISDEELEAALADSRRNSRTTRIRGTTIKPILRRMPSRLITALIHKPQMISLVLWRMPSTKPWPMWWIPRPDSIMSWPPSW